MQILFTFRSPYLVGGWFLIGDNSYSFKMTKIKRYKEA